MKFLADMGISISTVRWLREIGHDALHVRELRMQTSPDSIILDFAKLENRILLTCDLDFGSLLAASHVVLPSVVSFRLTDETPENINKRLHAVMKESSNTLETGSFVSVEQSRFRVRMLPMK